MLDSRASTGFACAGVALLLACLACEKDGASAGVPPDVSNALLLGMAKTQHRIISEKFHKGQDAAVDCVVDTAELRKDPNPEAAELARKIEQLCDHEIPAALARQALEQKLADVQRLRNDPEADLATELGQLTNQCQEAAMRVQTSTGAGQGDTAAVKSLASRRESICTPDNLDPTVSRPAKKQKPKAVQKKKAKRKRKGK